MNYDFRIWSDEKNAWINACSMEVVDTPIPPYKLDNSEYWLSTQNCWWNALYHSAHHNDKKNHTQRCGIVYYKGKMLYGEDPDFKKGADISVREFHYGCGHTWTETKDGFIIDWVINWKLGIKSSEKVKFSKSELEELGFKYVYYTNEDNILKKSRKTFSCKCKTIAKNQKENPIKYIQDECSVDWARKFWKNSL
jgi:hypothetical protein